MSTMLTGEQIEEERIHRVTFFLLYSEHSLLSFLFIIFSTFRQAHSSEMQLRRLLWL